MSKKLRLDKFQDSAQVLPMLGVLQGYFPLGVNQLCKNLGMNYQFSIIVVPIFCGQDNLLSRQFWAMGKFNLPGE